MCLEAMTAVPHSALSIQVTCMFYLIDAATKDVVEGGEVDQQRPPWLGNKNYCSPLSSAAHCSVA